MEVRPDPWYGVDINKYDPGNYEEEPQTHPEYTIPLFPQSRKPEPTYQPLFPETRPPGVINVERKFTYPPNEVNQGFYNKPSSIPNYGAWPPAQPDYRQTIKERPSYPPYQNPIKYPQYPMPNPQYEEPPQYYGEPRPSYQAGRYMPPQMPSYHQPEPQYDPYYRATPPGLYRPVPHTNYYMGEDNPGPYPGLGLYAGAPEYYPRNSIGMRPAKRNEFIEDFKQKLTYSKKIEIEELKGHIIELAKDQFGSRYLQQKVQKSLPEERQLVFDEIKSQASELMSDVFGNYVIQVLMQKGSEEQQRILIDLIKGKVKTLSLDMYGCRCVQKAIEVGNIEQKTILLAEIKPWIPTFVDSQNANHVLQICIEMVPPQHIAFLLDHFKLNSLSMCKHPFGCRVMQRIIEKSKTIDVFSFFLILFS